MDLEMPVLTISGTFTLEPVREVVEFWDELLGFGVEVHVTPYAQIFQQLLDPASALRRNRVGANVVLLRWTDLLGRRSATTGHAIEWPDVEALIEQASSALSSFEHVVPCLLMLTPHEHGVQVFDRAATELDLRLAGTPNLFIERGADLMARYRVEEIHDPASDRFGHVPFTPAAIAAMGTGVARWYSALSRPPVKMFAVDADQTLWSGVVAENGMDGIAVGAPHAALQRSLVRQNEFGRLLCLLSKNDEADVREVFESHPGMLLRWGDLSAHRVDWESKPVNLEEVASGLELGLEGIVFLDDNPIECARMRADCPAVATIQVPTDPDQLDAFSEHMWLFDVPRLTTEDRNRAVMYRQNASRAESRHGAESLQSFLDSLELHVVIAPATAAEIPRLAQLTQRTNQFNANLIRCNESNVAPDAAAGDAFHRSVSARDRFGDYGMVGQVRARAVDHGLALDLFMLSCRALGRGIEHMMLAAAGEHALAKGLEEIVVLYRHGERNAPIREFLETAFKTRLESDEQWLRMPARSAAAVVFDASREDAGAKAMARISTGLPAGEAYPRHPDAGAIHERIACTLTTGERIERAMADRVRPRPDMSVGFIAPAPGPEGEIASIWREVLQIDAIGVHDRFQDLGGKSIHLVQVHAKLLDRLAVDLDITALFQHPTVASLAEFIGRRSQSDTTNSAQQRGARMREARMRAARRAGASA